MNRLNEINENILKCKEEYGRVNETIQLLAVTKNQPIEKIKTLLAEGHRRFGENRIQEAYSKWPALMDQYNVELHFIGHLQTNKAKEAVALFDVIQTLDSFRLAEKLANEEQKQNKKLSYFIEINIGKEAQKSGVFPEDFPEFLLKLREYFSLNIQGIMCIPPHNEDPSSYFKKMQTIAHLHDIKTLSMGMSEDYKLAIRYGATMVRIGTALFCDR